MNKSVPEFDIRCDTGPAVSVVTATGEVDMLTAPMLRTAIHDTLETPPAILILDLSAVSFLDSSGLETLMETHDTVRATQLRVVTSTAVPRPMQVTGLAEIIAVYDDLESALRPTD